MNATPSKISIRRLARAYGISVTSLCRHIANLNLSQTDIESPNLLAEALLESPKTRRGKLLKNLLSPAIRDNAAKQIHILKA